eukprot:4521438-Alexandrium_andersonii.AAC.1
MQAILSELTNARKYATELAAYELSKDLVQQFNKHAGRMEVIFKSVQKLVMAGCADATQYQPFQTKYSEWTAWYTPREKVAKSMCQSFKGKKKKEEQGSKAASSTD